MRGSGKTVETPWLETEVQRDDGEWVVFPFRVKVLFRTRNRTMKTIIELREPEKDWGPYDKTPWVPCFMPVRKMTELDKLEILWRVSNVCVDHYCEDEETRETLLAHAEVVHGPCEITEPAHALA